MARDCEDVGHVSIALRTMDHACRGLWSAAAAAAHRRVGRNVASAWRIAEPGSLLADPALFSLASATSAFWNQTTMCRLDHLTFSTCRVHHTRFMTSARTAAVYSTALSTVWG